MSLQKEVVEAYELENKVYILRRKAQDFSYTFHIEFSEAAIDSTETW